MRMQCLTHKQEVGAVHGVLFDLYLARSTTAFRAKSRSFGTQQHLRTRKCKRAQRNSALSRHGQVREKDRRQTQSLSRKTGGRVCICGATKHTSVPHYAKDQLLS